MLLIEYFNMQYVCLMSNEYGLAYMIKHHRRVTQYQAQPQVRHFYTTLLVIFRELVWQMITHCYSCDKYATIQAFLVYHQIERSIK